MKLYIYYLDLLSVSNLDPRKVLMGDDAVYDEIRSMLRKDVGEIESIKVQKRYVSGEEFLVEYIVKTNRGHVSVKYIYGKDPVDVLFRFYEWEWAEAEKKRSKQTT